MSSVQHPRCTVEVPEKQSVRKLKEWLSNFGDQHRQHFEKNQLRPPLGKVGYRVYSIEKRLSASASFESASTTNDGSSSFTPIEADPRPFPIRKQEFSSTWARGSPDGGIDRAPSDELRSASEGTNQLMPIVSRSVHAGAKEVTSWHPNARKGEEFIQDVGGEFEYDDVSEDDYLDAVSINTGRYTDPGTNAPWPSGRALSLSTSSRTRMIPRVSLPSRSSKDDLALTAQPRPTTCRIHPKHLLCVTPQKESRHESATIDPSSSVRDEADLGRTSDVLPVSKTISDRVASTISNESMSELFPCTWSEASDASTMSIRPVGIHDTRLSSIFAEETEKFNRQAILNAQCGVWYRSGTAIGSVHNVGPYQHEHALSQAGILPPTAASRTTQKKNAVESRKEELERKWSENRPPSHVKKVTWHVSSKGGGYKKKVYLDYK